MERRFSSLIVIFSLITIAWTYPTTVPPTPEVCSKMTPGHGPRPQKSQPPYKVDVSTNSIKGGNNVEVTLSGIEDSEFKGFYVQARDNNGSPIGVFIKADGVKTHGCGGIKNNGAHHAGRTPKQSVDVFWQAPRDYTGDVTFTATFVEEFETFWTLVKSSPVSISNTLNEEITRPHRNLITDSREESETPEATQESRVLNYNPYSPTPLRNEKFVSNDFSLSKSYEDSPNYSTTEISVTKTATLTPSSITRIRKSYYIPKPKLAYQHQDNTVHDHEEDCILSPHPHIHHHFTYGSINDPRQQNLPMYYNPDAVKQVPSTKFQSHGLSHGAGYLNLERPSPTPLLPQGVKYTNRPLNNNYTPFPGFRPSFFSSEYNNYNQKKQEHPTAHSYPYVGSNSRIPTWQRPNIPVYSNYPSNQGQHGILVGDYVPNTGIVLPKGMQTYQIPRYGYLVFNPKRGPPFYLIPVEDSASFEEAHNLGGDNFPILPQPAVAHLRSRSGGISFESRNSVDRKRAL